MSRRWSAPYGQDHLVDRIRLLLIDEVHLLNEPRGAHIETIVARLQCNIHIHLLIELFHKRISSFSQ